MTSRMTKMRPSRNNTSRKKAKRTMYSETMTMPVPLLKSFVGSKDTLSRLLAGYKAQLDFSLSDEQDIILTVTMKHRNHLDVVMGRLVDRYNKLVTVANNLMDARALVDEQNE